MPKFNGEIRLNENHLTMPLSWRKPTTIFWNAHGDTFHENTPIDAIDLMFGVISLTPHHIHQVLTKRPDRMDAYLADPLTPSRILQACEEFSELGIANPDDVPIVSLWPIPNVLLGVSVEDQTTADTRREPMLRLSANSWSTTDSSRTMGNKPFLKQLL